MRKDGDNAGLQWHYNSGGEKPDLEGRGEKNKEEKTKNKTNKS